MQFIPWYNPIYTAMWWKPRNPALGWWSVLINVLQCKNSKKAKDSVETVTSYGNFTYKVEWYAFFTNQFWVGEGGKLLLIKSKMHYME